MSHKVYVRDLGEEIEVSDDGRFELPQRSYSPAELKRIARDVNAAMRRSQKERLIEDD